jgi:DNA primase
MDLARLTVAEELAKLTAEKGLQAEVREASEDLIHADEEALTYRLRDAAETMAKARAVGQEDDAEYDIGDNGASINREERNALDALMESIRTGKSGD